MIPKATLTQKELSSHDNHGNPNPEYPHDGRCKSGHVAPPKTRFFKVDGPVLPPEFWGVYCEHCLVVANKLVQRRKKQA